MTNEEKFNEVARELAATLNRLGVDSALNIPDFILREMLADHLVAFARTCESYGRWIAQSKEAPAQQE